MGDCLPLQMNFEVKFTSPVTYKLKLAQTCSVRKDEVVFFKTRGKLVCKELFKS